MLHPATWNMGKMVMVNLVLSAVRRTPTGAAEPCRPGEHEHWEICLEGSQRERSGQTVSAEDLAETIADIAAADPETGGRVVVRWLGEDGDVRATRPGDFMSCMNELMEVVCEETPEDAENTDDHPLEDMRSILLDAADLLDERNMPSPE